MHFLPGRGTQVKMMEKGNITLNKIFMSDVKKNIWIHSFTANKKTLLYSVERRSIPNPTYKTREKQFCIFRVLLIFTRFYHFVNWLHEFNSICLYVYVFYSCPQMVWCLLLLMTNYPKDSQIDFSPVCVFKSRWCGVLYFWWQIIQKILMLTFLQSVFSKIDDVVSFTFDDRLSKGLEQLVLTSSAMLLSCTSVINQHSQTNFSSLYQDNYYFMLSLDNCYH